jgi:hypothetical protein
MRRFLLCFALAAGLLGLLAAPALASAKTFTVPYSGPHDYTPAIQAAFNAAVKAGPGSVVQLSAGHFYTNNIVVNGFQGTFQGAGEGKTVIDCLRGLNSSLSGVTGNSYGANLFFFDGGDINVSAMSFDITAFSPVDSASNGGNDFLSDMVDVTGNVVSSSFDQVAFVTGTGNDDGFNSDEALYIGGSGAVDANGAPTTFWSISGTESVCDCSFVGNDGVQIEGLVKGSATVTDNVITAQGGFGCLLFDNSDSAVAVCHNRIAGAVMEDVWILQGWQAGFGGFLPPLPAPHYLIADNQMLATGTAGGVWVEDDSSFYNGPNRLDATITNNAIALDNDGYDAGVDGVYAQGIRVLDNHIWGTGLAGIDVGVMTSLGTLPAAPASDWQIIGNDMGGLTASTDQGGPGAQIWLGPEADHCLVVGCGPTTALDQGTDDILINTTPVSDPPAASAALRSQLSKAHMFKETKPF